MIDETIDNEALEGETQENAGETPVEAISEPNPEPSSDEPEVAQPVASENPAAFEFTTGETYNLVETGTSHGRFIGAMQGGDVVAETTIYPDGVGVTVDHAGERSAHLIDAQTHEEAALRAVTARFSL